MDWYTLKSWLVRGLGLLVLGCLVVIFTRTLTREHGREFSLAFAMFVGGTAWALTMTSLAALDTAINIIPCWDLRASVFQHIEIIWGPLILAGLWFLVVVSRRDP